MYLLFVHACFILSESYEFQSFMILHELDTVMYSSGVWFLRLSGGIGSHMMSLIWVHHDTQHSSSGSLVFAHLGSILKKDASTVYKVFTCLL